MLLEAAGSDPIRWVIDGVVGSGVATMTWVAFVWNRAKKEGAIEARLDKIEVQLAKHEKEGVSHNLVQDEQIEKLRAQMWELAKQLSDVRGDMVRRQDHDALVQLVQSGFAALSTRMDDFFKRS